MAFVIDDVAAVAVEVAAEAAEVAEATAETSAATVEEVGSTSIEFAGSAAQDVEVIGDGIGESSLHIEEGIANGEVSDVASSKSSEILGDGIGETKLEEANKQELNLNEGQKAVIEEPEIVNKGLNDATNSISEFKNIKVDDNGKPFMKDGERIPNNEYDLKGFHYSTDDNGRIIKTEGSINRIPETTPRGNSPEIKDMAPRDDKGHVIALELGGADNPGNIVPMNAELNRFGDYRICEREVKQAVLEGKEVKISIEMEYEGVSSRPTLFHYTYEIDGEITERTFLNK